LAINGPSSAAFSFCADIPFTYKTWAKYETAALFANRSGKHQTTVFHVWPLICDTRLLARVLSMCRMTWSVSITHTELVSTCYMGYSSITKDGREAFCMTPKTAQCVVKALVAARLPHLAEKADVLAFLPAAEAQFADLTRQLWGSGLPLSLICSLAARHLGGNKQMLMYAKEELMGNLNPPRQALAQAALAVALRRTRA
jgi:hypothetical protein